MLAENVIAAWLDLEVASGNDAIASHSEIRKTAKLMGQFLPGTDFVTSGYSAMPRYDNMFGGGNYDSDDLDEWLTLQRDWQVDAGIEPLDEAARSPCASARRTRSGGLRRARLPADQRRGGATRRDVPRLARPARPRPCGRRARRRPRARGGDQRARRRAGARQPRVRRRRRRRCSACSARRSPRTTCRPRRSSTHDGTVVSAVNDPNGYLGPGTGYRLEGERWERLQQLPHTIDARLLGSSARATTDASRSPATRCGTRRGRDRDRGRAGVRHRSRRDDQRPLPRRRAASARRGHAQRGRRAARRARPPLVRRRLHRPRRRTPLRLGHRGRTPVEGHGADPPRRPGAARQPRAVRHGAVADARLVSPDRRERGRAMRSADRSRRCRR